MGGGTERNRQSTWQQAWQRWEASGQARVGTQRGNRKARDENDDEKPTIEGWAFPVYLAR